MRLCTLCQLGTTRWCRTCGRCRHLCLVDRSHLFNSGTAALAQAAADYEEAQRQQPTLFARDERVLA